MDAQQVHFTSYVYSLGCIFVVGLLRSRAPRLQKAAKWGLLTWLLETPGLLVMATGASANTVHRVLLGASPVVWLPPTSLAISVLLLLVATNALVRGRRLCPYLAAAGLVLLCQALGSATAGLAAGTMLLLLLQGYEYAIWQRLRRDSVQSRCHVYSVWTKYRPERLRQTWGTLDALVVIGSLLLAGVDPALPRLGWNVLTAIYILPLALICFWPLHVLPFLVPGASKLSNWMAASTLHERGQENRSADTSRERGCDANQ